MEKKRNSRTALEARLEWWKFMFLVSSVCGGVFGLLGMTLGLMSLLRLLVFQSFLDDLGTALLVVAFPLIILAAHSLDKAYEADKAITMEYRRRVGMMDDNTK